MAILLIQTLNIVKSWKTIAYRILKFESNIKKPIVTNHAFFLRLYQFCRYTELTIPNLKKDCHQDKLSFACLESYKHNCLNILADNICFYI